MVTENSPGCLISTIDQWWLINSNKYSRLKDIQTILVTVCYQANQSVCAIYVNYSVMLRKLKENWSYEGWENCPNCPGRSIGAMVWVWLTQTNPIEMHMAFNIQQTKLYVSTDRALTMFPNN